MWQKNQFEDAYIVGCEIRDCVQWVRNYFSRFKGAEVMGWKISMLLNFVFLNFGLVPEFFARGGLKLEPAGGHFPYYFFAIVQSCLFGLSIAHANKSATQHRLKSPFNKLVDLPIFNSSRRDSFLNSASFIAWCPFNSSFFR